MMLITTWFGSFLFDKDAVVRSNPFPKDSKEIAKRMDVIAKGKVLGEEKQLAEGIPQFYVLDPRLSPLGGELIEEEIPQINPQDFGFSNDLLHEAMMSLAQDVSKSEVKSQESIVQAVNALDDLIQSTNLLSERLFEWYGMHHPRQRKVMRDEDLVSLILSEKGREGDKKEDLAPVIGLANTLNDINLQKNQLEDYIKVKMEQNANNISYLVGPIIGARLIAKAGGLNNLAKLPSGTIQVLGAEKALFRHLKDGSNPPKHGFLFQHPLVHRAPYWQRGKIARAIASKVAIAAKMDEHSDRMIGEELKKDLLERIEEIRERYPKPQKKGKKK
jgi:nucleolar protein 56